MIVSKRIILNSNEIITQQKAGFLASDDELLSISRLIELIAKNLDKKI